ncbi:DUF885 domain-containing protein [Jiangella asiatica]|uniref:DUF885 domain-containing protein n=1 Tax=Jiangella asiatica TaxID=2530372 RepID=A0A4V2Z2U7_9ACTN|nr:DUF885 domain-containing protein [Jiangella asiatica]TDE10158.1 DUF885 domain-containing protein [Jiangella asiatica]
MTIAQLADELLDVLLDAAPLEASLLGIRDREDRLTDYTEAGETAVDRRLAELAERARAVDPAGLSPDDRVTRSVVLRQIEIERDRLATRGIEYTVVNSFFAPAVGTLSELPLVGITEQAHADGYLARLAALPTLFAAIAERHRSGVAAGRLPVRRLAEATVAHFERYLAAPADDPLRRPEPAPGSGADTGAFRAERDRLLTDVVYPAVGRYRDAVAADVVPYGRPDDRPGLSWLPGGDDFYARLARGHTTTDRTPDQLHQTGLEVLARLTDEYAEVGSRVFGTTDLRDILGRLRTDPAMRWKDGDELLAAARSAIMRAEEVAPRWFGRLPSQSCVVEAVPAAEAPGAPGAYYMQPALDGSRPGTYFANTHEAEKRDRYSAESVAFHEGVPGHHFQITISQELTHLPRLRRLMGVTAYDEGWGLYTERLADEMSLYSDDVARLGMLSEDSLRACRLVVDTGLHAKGWSRQQAVDFMVANTATSQVEIETEVDRYISAPGQALAYMVGRLEIQRIRAVAEAALGDAFDIRAFHDVVLGSGALPMGVLDEVVRAWVDGQG